MYIAPTIAALDELAQTIAAGHDGTPQALVIGELLFEALREEGFQPLGAWKPVLQEASEPCLTLTGQIRDSSLGATSGISLTLLRATMAGSSKWRLLVNITPPGVNPDLLNVGGWALLSSLSHRSEGLGPDEGMALLSSAHHCADSALRADSLLEAAEDVSLGFFFGRVAVLLSKIAASVSQA